MRSGDSRTVAAAEKTDIPVWQAIFGRGKDGFNLLRDSKRISINYVT